MLEQTVFGTLVQVELSGEVWNVTVVERLPVVEKLTRQFTQGLLPERFATPVAGVEFPIAVKVKTQSFV